MEKKEPGRIVDPKYSGLSSEKLSKEDCVASSGFLGRGARGKALRGSSPGPEPLKPQLLDWVGGAARGFALKVSGLLSGSAAL